MVKSDFEDYLLLNKWNLLSSSDRATAYSPTGDIEDAVVISKGLEKGSQIESELIKLCATRLEKPVSEITNAVAYFRSDVAEYRIKEVDEDGAIALSSGVEILCAASRLTRLAATTAIRPRPIAGGYSESSDTIANKLKLAHSKPGSFIFTTYMEIPQPESQERLVMSTLAQSLIGIQEFVIKPEVSPSADTVRHLVDLGVCQEMVGTLRGLVDKGSGMDTIEIGFSWSPFFNVPDSFIPQSFKMERAFAEKFIKFEQQLKSLNEITK